jgi:hypothetical protein
MAKLINRDECPPLHQRDDRRLEKGFKTPEFPSLYRPVASIRDPGTVRLGDGFITAEFPPQHRPSITRCGAGIPSSRR